jgi:hypothetical protein
MIEFYSSEGTKYLWDTTSDNFIDLTPLEIQWTRAKVQLMSDQTILNQVSGNNIQMGIPLHVSNSRLKETHTNLKRIIKASPVINIESHAIDRLVEDWTLPDNHPNKRGWVDEDDIRSCVRTMYRVIGLRLNVNHQHRDNTQGTKYLHPQISITMIGKKASGDGRLVSAVLNEGLITVITIL